VDDIWTRIQERKHKLSDDDFREIRVRFLQLAKRRVGERDAEDVAQEACLTVFEKCRELPQGVNLPAWALQVLRNKIGNCLMRRARSVEAAGEGQLWEFAAAGESALEARLIDCLHRVSRFNRRYARTLNLIFAGYSADEISRRLDISRGSLYVLLHRARYQLRKCLEGRKD
jgi:RNA polymerase sigma factor (sigma-70 family)